MNKEDLKKLLPDVIVENLSEEKLAKLGKEFERLVEAKVDERTQIAVKCAETQFNEEANAKLQKLVVQIDEAHKKAFFEAYNSICDSYEKQLSRVKHFYNTKVKKSSADFQKKLLESVSLFIDKEVDKLLPTKQVRAAVKNTAAMETLQSFKQLLNVNEATAKEEIRQPIIEATACINKQRKANSSLKEENQSLKKQLAALEAKQFLNECTDNLPSEAKNFVRRVLKDSSKKYIKENLNHVLAQYKKNVESTRKSLLEKTLVKRYNTNSNINNVSRKRLIESSAKPSRVSQPVDPEAAQIQQIIQQFT